jgi:hypothetical protein
MLSRRWRWKSHGSKAELFRLILRFRTESTDRKTVTLTPSLTGKGPLSFLDNNLSAVRRLTMCRPGGLTCLRYNDDGVPIYGGFEVSKRLLDAEGEAAPVTHRR